jgi:hypothetical protein
VLCRDIGSSGVGSYSARNEGLPQEYLNSALARESQTSTRTSSDQLKEQEELELAIAMSLNEQENKQVKQSSSKPTPKPVQVSSRHQPEPQPTQYASISYGEVSCPPTSCLFILCQSMYFCYRRFQKMMCRTQQ